MTYEGNNSKVKTLNLKRLGEYGNMGVRTGTHPIFKKLWVEGDNQKTQFLIYNAKSNSWEVRRKMKTMS